MPISAKEQWLLSKPAITGQNGLVASQHYLASDAGAKILQMGGNAVDAAIATGLMLGTVEPWMSGIGGGGYMTVYQAKQNRVQIVEFGMQAPLTSSPADYPLADEGTNASDSFNWPAVTNDTNIHGPLAVAIPGYLKGIGLASQAFGSLPFSKLIEPACEQAELGLPLDWYSCSKINQLARGLRQYKTTTETYLSDGLPPAAHAEGLLSYLPLGSLATTYRQIQAEGPESFYTGTLSQKIVQDLNKAGSKISQEDLNQYQAVITDPLFLRYREHDFYVSGELTAGPSIIHALTRLNSLMPQPPDTPDENSYLAFAESLYSSYENRLLNLGAGQGHSGNTSHICCTDQEGNMVSLTQTIMSGFGSRIMLPDSGVLLNNGMMWFDPRPGGPNSVVPGRKPLCNMCPVVGRKSNGDWFALGACGGRKIFPAVFQLASFIMDFNMDAGQAAHQPRIDVSGTEMLSMMSDLPENVADLLKSHYPEHRVRANGVSPNLFALPQLILQSKGQAQGACFIPSPHAKVSAA